MRCRPPSRTLGGRVTGNLVMEGLSNSTLTLMKLSTKRRAVCRTPQAVIQNKVHRTTQTMILIKSRGLTTRAQETGGTEKQVKDTTRCNQKNPARESTTEVTHFMQKCNARQKERGGGAQ